MSTFEDSIAKNQTEIERVIQKINTAVSQKDITALRRSIHELNSIQKEIDDITRITHSLEEILKFMFIYREIHRIGKMYAYGGMMSLYLKVKNEDFGLTDEGKKKKPEILVSLSMNIISYGITIIEDFLSFCYCLSYDLEEIPSRMVAYRDSNRILRYANLLKEDSDECFKILHYLTEDEVKKLPSDLFSISDKEMIIQLHKQNVEAFQHVLTYAIKFYSRYKDANNKYKHGFPFLFAAMMTPEGPLKELSPVIPYFCNERDIENVSGVFVGDKVLDKLNQLITANHGGIFQLMMSLSNNVSLRAKCGGNKVMASEFWGKEYPTKEIQDRYEKISSIFIDKYVIDKTPKQMSLNIKSHMKLKEWEWLTEDWKFK